MENQPLDLRPGRKGWLLKYSGLDVAFCPDMGVDSLATNIMKEIRSLFFPVVACLFWAQTSLVFAVETNPLTNLSALQMRLDNYLAQPKYETALWGIKVISATSGRTIYEHHPERLMSPASNSKLFTGALALDTLGGDFRFRTPVLAAGRIQANGTLQGDLWVVGQGDPSWNERRLGTNFLAVFDPFIAILTKAGEAFVTPLSVSALTGDKVDTDLFSLTDEAEMGHIEMSRDADLLVVAPATATTLSFSCPLKPGLTISTV